MIKEGLEYTFTYLGCSHGLNGRGNLGGNGWLQSIQNLHGNGLPVHRLSGGGKVAGEGLLADSLTSQGRGDCLPDAGGEGGYDLLHQAALTGAGAPAAGEAALLPHKPAAAAAAAGGGGAQSIGHSSLDVRAES